MSAADFFARYSSGPAFSLAAQPGYAYLVDGETMIAMRPERHGEVRLRTPSDLRGDNARVMTVAEWDAAVDAGRIARAS